jgi:uncharacterized protein YdiU (UPF0061 family)
MIMSTSILIPNIVRTSYLRLSEHFYEVINPTPITNPYLVQYNHDLASLLSGQNAASYTDQEIIAICAGNWVPKHLQSIALAYAGHQFGYYVPILGDGRALMLGQICAPDGKVWDIQLKGSGKTRFSRMGDGRAPLSATLREYLISEAMHGLKIPTTRCLAIIGGEEQIYRTPGLVPIGVLTRIALSSLRIGSFEYAANQKEKHLLKRLADYAIKRHFPELLQDKLPYLNLFKTVVDNQASLISEWMSVGFIHGVMNTDNMSISGETIDYGPCAFMDEFDMNTVFSSIDMYGRYSFGNQAAIAHWNLARFGQTLLPLVSEQDQEAPQQLEEILDSFPHRFHEYWNKKIHFKLGLIKENKNSTELVQTFFMLLQQHKPDFTNTFRLMAKAIDSKTYQEQLLQALGNQKSSEQWISDWLSYIKHQGTDLNTIKIKMNSVNPAYIPRNHLVEQAINAFVEQQDNTLMNELLSVLKHPYEQQKNTKHLQQPPSPEERVLQTFCGT